AGEAGSKERIEEDRLTGLGVGALRISAEFVARRDLRLHLRGRDRAAVEEHRDLIAEGPPAIDAHEDVPLVVRPARVRAGGPQRVVAQEGLPAHRVVGNGTTELVVGGGARDKPAIEAARHVLSPTPEERTHVLWTRAREPSEATH